MDRRKFIKDTAIYSAGVAASTHIIGMGTKALAAPATESVVGVAEGPKWSELARAALEPLGGIQAFVKPGSTVVIKPNAAFDRTPEQAANTHPDVVKSVIELCLEAGAKRVNLFDGTLNEKRRSYMNSGIGPAVETIKDKRVDLSFMDERKFVPVTIHNGKIFKKWKFYKDALDADVYISLPIFKDHSLARVTAGMKNILGILGGRREKIHWKLHQGIADLNTVLKPHLTITDATRILMRNGPQGGKLEDVEIRNTVIASGDVVAADAFATKHLFGIEPTDIGYIKIAGEMGIGVSDLNKIQVINA